MVAAMWSTSLCEQEHRHGQPCSTTLIWQPLYDCNNNPRHVCQEWARHGSHCTYISRAPGHRDVGLLGGVGKRAVATVAQQLAGPCKKRFMNKMWFKLLYYRTLSTWIRDVFWLGPLGPGTQGAGSKTHLHTPKAVTYHEQSQYCDCS